MARSSFLFRTDPKVLDALRRWADDEFRSVNGQLEFLVRDALRRSGRLDDASGKGGDGRKPTSD
ncbi:MAG: Arc family DNA-binding protein [Pseudomonadota bacterium]